MKHLSDEDLVLHYYGERGDDTARTHMEACESCCASYQLLKRVLDAMDAFEVPQPSEGYELQVWHEIAPRLESLRPRSGSASSWWLAPRQLGLAGAMAALLVISFFAGRFSRRPVETAALTGQVRERIMLVAVGEHLEQSQMILVELVNNESKGTVDMSGEQRRAEDLIGENRLYRQAALKTGDTAVSNVLDDLERVLLEIAHSPSKLDSAEFDQVRQRIEANGILFKIRVVGTNLRQREKARVARTASNTL